MFNEEKQDYSINEEEVIKAFLIFHGFSPDKQAFAIAFINGMEFQRRLDETQAEMKQPCKLTKQAT